MKKGIIFDVDGTLWDGTRSITDSWNEFREKNIPEIPDPFTEKQMQSVLGKTMTEISDIILAVLPPERRYAVMEELLSYEVRYMWDKGGEVYPRAKEVMTELRDMGYRLYIVSNCQQGYIEDFLHCSGTEDLVEDHVCFGDTLKPKSESLRLCAERNGLDWAVYVGDTQGDLDSVIGAGLPCDCGKVPFIFASYGFGSVDENIPCLPPVASLSELPGVIRDIQGKQC